MENRVNAKASLRNNENDEKAKTPFSLPPHLNVKTNLTSQILAEKKIWLANAVVTGDVRLGEDVSVWYNAVVRGDVNYIAIGNRSNIQDGAILHVTNSAPCIIGQEVTIGHGAMVHAARVSHSVLIGMGSIVLSGAVIKEGSVIAAGALIREKEIVEPFSLMAGVPAKKIRTLPEKTMEENRGWANKYVLLKNKYLEK